MFNLFHIIRSRAEEREVAACMLISARPFVKCFSSCRGSIVSKAIVVTHKGPTLCIFPGWHHNNPQFPMLGARCCQQRVRSLGRHQGRWEYWFHAHHSVPFRHDLHHQGRPRREEGLGMGRFFWETSCHRLDAVNATAYWFNLVFCDGATVPVSCGDSFRSAT